MANTLKKANKKGFTLVELVVVIAILAILAVIAIPTVGKVINTANVNVDKANCQTIELALKSANAEATAGTWEVTDATKVTVEKALEYEGLNLKTLVENIKTKGVTSFYYSKGKISVESKDTVAPLIETTKVKDFIDGTK